ncbi:MAG: hypothetical protein AB1668_07185 [Nanoarchaeota archaeon]
MAPQDSLKDSGKSNVPPATSSYRRISDIYDVITKEKSRRYLYITALAGAIAAGVGFGATVGHYSLADRLIPGDEIVEEGLYSSKRTESTLL